MKCIGCSRPVSDEIVAALFDPLKRQSTANERNRTGMGLGLCIAHQVVRGHQGHGTLTFEARIPVRRSVG